MAAREDCNLLLAAVMPFAQNALRKYGEFYPYAARLSSKREIVSVAASSGSESPLSDDLAEQLRESLRASAVAAESIATALVYMVQIGRPGETQKADAIAVDLDHRENYSVTVFFPYVIVDQTVVLRESVANSGLNAIFTRLKKS